MTPKHRNPNQIFHLKESVQNFNGMKQLKQSKAELRKQNKLEKQKIWMLGKQIPIPRSG